jgi:hypothetical protein
MAIHDFELVKIAFLDELRKMAASMLLRRALPGAAVGAAAGALTASPELGESRLEQALNYGLGGAALTAGGGKLLEHQALKRGRRELLGQYKRGLKKLHGLPLGRAEASMAKGQLQQNVRSAGSEFEQRVRSTPFFGV